MTRTKAPMPGTGFQPTQIGVLLLHRVGSRNLDLGRLEIAETGSNISFPKKLDFDPMTANKIVLSLVDGSSSVLSPARVFFAIVLGCRIAVNWS